MLRSALTACFFTSALCAQPPPDTGELLDALARSAAIFARTLPNLSAREALYQRGRRGDMQVIRKGRHNEIKEIEVRIPPGFESHEIISAWRFAAAGPASGLHEIRTIMTIDSTPPESSAGSRHALTIGLRSPDDDIKKQLLEHLESNQLEGAVTDFSPMLLLFQRARQGDYRITFGSDGRIDSEPAFLLRYRQIAGAEAFTEFRERAEVRHPAEGEIWLRQADLLPLRITIASEEAITAKFTLRNEAEIDYRPTPYGLAPAVVIHKQFLNRDLLVENRFMYSDYGGRVPLP